MSRAGWIAVVAAAAFPSIALLVVTLSPGPPPPLPGLGPGHGPPPHRPGLKRGPPPEVVQDEVLLSLRGPLGLTEEQVEQIRAIGEPAKAQMREARQAVMAREDRLRRLLDSEGVEEGEIERSLEELHQALLRRDLLDVLTPLRLKRVLTEEQRERLLELWRERRVPLKAPRVGPPPGGKAPPFGPPPPGAFPGGPP